MLKRDAALFLRCLLPALALTVIFALVCAAAAMTVVRGAEDVYRPVKVAVVDEEDSLVSRLLVNMVSDMDDIAALMEVERMDMEEAKNTIKSGDSAAAIVLPENFVSDISRGEYSRGQIILSPAAASNSHVVELTARFGELLLAAGQYGIFSGEELIWEYELGAAFHDVFLARVNTALLEEAVSGGEAYFDVVVTDYADTSMTTGSYYGMNWLTLILFMSSLFFAKLYRTDLTRPMLCRLRAAGLEDGAFLLGKLLYPILFRVALLGLALILLPRFLDMELSGKACLIAFVAAVAAGVIGTALGMCLRSGAAANAILAMAGLFLCGGIVPRQMLPRTVLSVGAYSPFGAVQSFLEPLFGGSFSPLRALLALGYAAAALLWLFCSLKKMRVGGGEE